MKNVLTWSTSRTQGLERCRTYGNQSAAQQALMDYYEDLCISHPDHERTFSDDDTMFVFRTRTNDDQPFTVRAMLVR